MANWDAQFISRGPRNDDLCRQSVLGDHRRRTRAAVRPYGTRERVEMLVDRVTGRSRGFGFVAMPNSTEAQAAMTALNGASRGGRPLTVSEARPREERRPRDDGGGRRRPRW